MLGAAKPAPEQTCTVCSTCPCRDLQKLGRPEAPLEKFHTCGTQAYLGIKLLTTVRTQTECNALVTMGTQTEEQPSSPPSHVVVSVNAMHINGTVRQRRPGRPKARRKPQRTVGGSRKGWSCCHSGQEPPNGWKSSSRGRRIKAVFRHCSCP